MSEMIKVGMADLKLCKSPDAITTLGLGSCIGISMYDPTTKIGGLAHVMLPDSTEIKNNTNIPKFADTGTEELVKRVVAKGANRSRLVAKIAGGAQMFAFNSNNATMRVGERNVLAVLKKLKEMNIPLSISQCGIEKHEYMNAVEDMAEKALEDACTKTNPRVPSKAEICLILEHLYD